MNCNKLYTSDFQTNRKDSKKKVENFANFISHAFDSVMHIKFAALTITLSFQAYCAMTSVELV